MNQSRLPSSVAEIATVIGRERALYLISILPRCQTKKSTHVILYVPKTMRADHPLVRMMGFHDAERLRQAFGGEILQPATCADLYRPFRDAGIRRLADEGVPIRMIAQWFDVGERTVKNLLQEIPQEGIGVPGRETVRVVYKG